ncbi:hypothetical protein JGD76_23170, partial [Salmonella enterica subsp. enterica serovar London]|nr:hypothetical protein [Salmonella enterica subsp. enterica serovar London]
MHTIYLHNLYFYGTKGYDIGAGGILNFKFMKSLFSHFSLSSSNASSSTGSPGSSKIKFKESSKSIFKEEINFEDCNQVVDNWEMPKIPSKELYHNKSNFFTKTAYHIKTEESFMQVDSEQEEFVLLSAKDINKYSHQYNFLHLGCVQVAAKPMTRLGLNTAILMCLRDSRHLDFKDSLIGAVETSVSAEPVWFNCILDM